MSILKIIDPRTKKLKITKLTQALRNNQTLYANETKILTVETNNTTASEQVNKTFVVTSNPVEVVIKKPNSFKFASNLTVVGMRGSASNSVAKKEKAKEKGGRGKRSALYQGDYDYPSSKEIPKVSSDEFSPRSVDSASLLDSASFDKEFVAARRSFTKKKRPTSFMSSTFFSGEDFLHSTISDISLGIDQSGEDELETEDEDYTDDEKDAYDIHGYRGAAEDRSSGPKPPAYGLAANHDFKPVRGSTGQPVTFPQHKPPTVGGFKTSIIHKYPGFALPGTSTESSAPMSTHSQEMNKVNIHSHEMNKLNMHSHEMNKLQNQAQGMGPSHMNANGGSEGNNKDENKNEEDDDSDEHHHHHFYDQLRHVHINPPKGFDPDSFRLTLPHFIKKGKYVGKKHKHFHHIENAPVIIKYESPTTAAPTARPAAKPHTSRKPHSSRKPTDRPLTESEEEAMYDEEGEISEKEIENAYKNYDDSGITKAVIPDYGGAEEEEEEEEESEESGEETRLEEVKTLLQPKADTKQAVLHSNAFKNVSKLDNNVTRKSNSLKNSWNIGYSLK